MILLIKILLLLLVSIGIFDSSFLLYINIFLSGDCTSFGILGGSCEDVTQSEWGNLLGIPISLFGFVAYSSLFLLILRSFYVAQFGTIILFITGIGTGISIFLVYLQAFVIEKWCPLCLISASTFSTLFLLSGLLFILARKTVSSPKELLPSKMTFLKTSQLFLTILGVSLIFYLWMDLNKTKKSFLTQNLKTDIECIGLASGEPFASLNRRLVGTETLDPFFLTMDSPVCNQINKQRVEVLTYLLALETFTNNPVQQTKTYPITSKLLDGEGLLDMVASLATPDSQPLEKQNKLDLTPTNHLFSKENFRRYTEKKGQLNTKEQEDFLLEVEKMQTKNKYRVNVEF